MTGEDDRQRRLRLIAQRDVPERRAVRAPGLDELAALVESQAELQRRFDDWIEAASVSGREVSERIGGLERIGRRAIAETRRSTSDASRRLHAIVADERVRRAEHARMMKDYARQAAALEQARLGIEALGVSQSRWVFAACVSGFAATILAAILGWRLIGI